MTDMSECHPVLGGKGYWTGANAPLIVYTWKLSALSYYCVCLPQNGTWDLPPSAADTHNWDTATNGNLLFFLLAVISWPAAFVDDPNATIMTHLGRYFDAARIDNSRLHAVYNSWAGFGSRATLHIFKSYSGAVNALPAGAALPRT